jgi:glutamine synthetase
VEKNIYRLTAEERAAMNIASLPGNLSEALNNLENNKVILDALGGHISRRFLEAKRLEHQEYEMMVHQWETDRYLAKF